GGTGGLAFLRHRRGALRPWAAGDYLEGAVGEAACRVGLSLDGVAPEAAAQRREQPVGEAPLVPRLEPLEQRRRDDGGGHAEGDGLLDRPPSLARVRHPGGDAFEAGARGEGFGREVEEPGADDGAL